MWRIYRASPTLPDGYTAVGDMPEYDSGSVILSYCRRCGAAVPVVSEDCEAVRLHDAWHGGQQPE